ncbi:hypothetical protein RclHR1_00410001 [Rhizophagus clarus]|uniref:Uncharacterized protein n=1 Tax=Rhizophagus clarus TaxID=94130 RepID=A0A2Z6RGI2_9GLOM|nr:hypothetical protein RclHR1_00410001 [Rhizophagus clarus]
MSQPNQLQVAEEELFDFLKEKFEVCILESLERKRKSLNRLWLCSNSWDIQQNVPYIQTERIFRYPGNTSLELAKYWDVCPFFLEYAQQLSYKTLERALERALSRSWK